MAENKTVVSKIGNVVTIKILDRMISRRTKELSRVLEKSIAESGGKVRLLLSIESRFPGKCAEELFENLQFTKLHAENIDRLAIVGSRPPERTYTALFGLWGGINLRYFDRSEAAKAIEWLQRE